jgi:hypothetical protein
MQAMALASFLSCMKQGGGVDIIKALKYFDALDVILSMVPQQVQHSRSALLLDSLPGYSGKPDPQWYLSQMDTMDSVGLSNEETAVAGLRDEECGATKPIKKGRREICL